MKWSDVKCDSWVHSPFDENERAIKGFALASWGMDLENIPDKCFDKCARYYPEGRQFSGYRQEKIYVSDIIGSSYDMYSNISWIEAFQKIKRASGYILRGDTTIGKYQWQLKKSCVNQWNDIKLTRTNTGLFVDGNGNHRIIIYKMMLFSESAMCSAYEANSINNRYWLNAMVKNEL